MKTIRTIKLIIKLFLSILLMVSYSYSIELTQEEKDWLKKHSIVKIGIDHNWAPIEFVDSDGTYKGLASDYFKELEKLLGIKFEVYVPKETWAEVLEKVEQRELDIISCAVATNDRKKYAKFTKAYLQFPLSIVTKNDINYISDLDKINGKKIAVIKNYASGIYLKENYPKLELLEVKNIEEALEKVATNEAFAYVGVLPSVSYYIKKLGYHHLKFSGELSDTYNLAIGVRDDWPILVTILNKALDSITMQTKDKIYNDWIQLTYIKPMYEKYLFYSLMVVILITFMLTYKIMLNKKYAKLLEEKNKELEELSFKDSLTNICNRRRIEFLLNKEVLRRNRINYKLTVIMVDIDFFKKVNDKYGHAIGDEVLKEFTNAISKNIRKTDHFGRYGGEEFLIICPDTGIVGAKKLAETLRNLIEKTRFSKKNLSLTSSFGIADLKDNELPDDILKRADDALYLSKNNGRNTISLL